MLAAAHKSSGKTTVSIGLCASLSAQGLIVQPFKKGPDYIDCLWLSQAAKRDCHNLDFHLMNETEIKTVMASSNNADIAIIEGNMGLYDSIDLAGTGSNAALAKLLASPVILVLNPHGMTRSIAPIILGFQAFDVDLHIAGVILNQVASARHESKLIQAIEHYTDVPILGSIRRNLALQIEERHLGLIPSNEAAHVTSKITEIANIVADSVQLEQILAIAQQAPPPATIIQPKKAIIQPNVRIGIVRDNAFAFYYPSDLTALQDAGAELIFINALQDKCLPNIDGLFIGGGFPETQARALAANHELKQNIKQAIENGLPVYAECGGLMYLARRLLWQEQSWDMVGALPLDTVMQPKPKGSGYTVVQETAHSLWPLTGYSEIAAHEFHYSHAINIDANLRYAYKIKRGYGINGEHDGIVYRNTLACYTHFKNGQQNNWVQRFIQFVQQVKEQRHV
jgi:cobyrinic acid a,c-diamide synthase